MKVKNLIKALLIPLLTASSIIGIAQEKNPQTSKYIRSSLYTLMVDDPSRPMADTIKLSFLKTPIPDKFNDHNGTIRLINVSNLGSNPVEGISKFLAEKQIAKEMVAKWFNRNPNTGAFDMNLIQERGFYNATDLDVKKALASKRGMATIADAGEELIKNTFVVVNDFNYVNKEEVGQAAAVGFKLLGDVAAAYTGNSAYSTAGNLAAVGTAIASKGYIVKNKSYLFQLVWDDSVAAVFYNDLWFDASAPDAARKAAFENSNIFRLKYIGQSNSLADVQSTILTSKSNEELIADATSRSVEAGIYKLQKAYEVFRTKTPLFSTNPPVAKIGLKEGLRKQDRFVVYERTTNKEGRIIYKKYATLRVKNKYIWDNRFVATGESSPEGNYTRFYQTSGKKLYPGLLIKQKPDIGLFKPSMILLNQLSRIFY
jgi:hypothetical protein